MKPHHSDLKKFTLTTVIAGTLLFSGIAHSEDNDAAEFMLNEAKKAQAEYAIYKKAEDAILKDPQSMLEQIVLEINRSTETAKSKSPLYELGVRYQANFAPGVFHSVQITQSKNGRATLLLNVHEAAKHNPFVLLDAVIGMNQLYQLDNFSTVNMTLLPGANPANGMTAFEQTYHSISRVIGLSIPFAEKISLTPVEILEIQANAEAGSLFAQRTMAANKIKDFKCMMASLETFLPLQKLPEEQKRSALLEFASLKNIKLQSTTHSYQDMLKIIEDQMLSKQSSDLEEITARAKKAYRAQVQEYKDKAEEREAVVQTQSLSEMVKANDREGVAQAMEKMLPWSLLEPLEKLFWKDFVESIRHPNYTNAPILFRGIDANEKFQAVTDKNGIVNGGGLFSKRLTAGSGSHLFKLKGLPETFETFGTSGAFSDKRISPLVSPHTLTKMIMNHADEPKGSPFISLSYGLETAFSFSEGTTLIITPDMNQEKALEKYRNSNASGGVATIRIDPRRLVTNSVSAFPKELEVLASMLIFPDEVLYLEKGIVYSVMQNGELQKKKTTPQEYYKRARKAVYEKTGTTLPASYKRIEIEGSKSFYEGLKDMGARIQRLNPHQAAMCSKVFQ